MRKIISLFIALTFVFATCSISEEQPAEYDDKLTVVAMLGEQSDFIYAVECALFEKGYLAEECVDGIFDEYTELAVMDFQYFKGYEADGMLTKIQFYWLSRKYYNNWFDTSDIAWITASGSRYHVYGCKALQNSTGIMPISVNIAYSLGYEPCRLCNPY